MALRACATCARPFTPTLHGQRHCLTHQPRGRASRSPTTRKQDATYYRNRATVLKRDPTCWHPNCTAPSTQADHITPASKGGSNDLTNLRGSCAFHNLSRGNRTT